MSEIRKGGLVIADRPQISVELNSLGEISISVASISNDMERVEFHEVFIPIDCAEQVANAMLKLLRD